MRLLRVAVSRTWVLHRRSISCDYLRLSCAHDKSSFDLALATAEYERRTEDACLNRRRGSSDVPFRIVLPPPNVTGKLHLGHALTVAVEDAMCRYNRAYGRQVVWYPGFDHAGIATQAVVEKQLWRQRALRRHQISDAEFLQLCNSWKNSRIADISMQLKKLGATLDWSASYFTMDKRFSQAVLTAFCRLHREGLIFNDSRLVNWCPTLQSTISDQEVDYVDVSDVEWLCVPSAEDRNRKIRVGVMHRVRYPLLDCSDGEVAYLEAATSRPETVFADVALAVNPRDSRYSACIGRFVGHPLVPGRRLPIVGDDAVKPDKGTGVLKITPTHDFVDFEIARRHADILAADVMDVGCVDEKGLMKNAGTLSGIDRFIARHTVVDMLCAKGVYGGEMRYSEGQVATCSRTGDVVEPMLKRQWFMRTDEVNDAAMDAVASGELRITPEFVRAQLEEWLNNKEPWCLSRQLVWGHRIPAFRRNSTSGWIVAENETEARKLLRLEAGDLDAAAALEQDCDVLDTWFSSALIPLVIAGWPQKHLSSVPLAVMETGHDIIGFWVARMVTLCQRLSGQLPFKEVVLHGLVRDGSGRKMSKSLGNVVDPNDVIDGISLREMIDRLGESSLSTTEQVRAEAEIRTKFPKGLRGYGADALRYGLLRHDVTALDVNLNIAESADEGLRFCNKLWNLCSYLELVDSKATAVEQPNLEVHVTDRWLCSRLARTFADVRAHMDARRPHLALAAVRSFLVADVCDVYLETTKKALRLDNKARLLQVSSVLHEAVDCALVLLSVFMPFASEHLFKRISRVSKRSIYDVMLAEEEPKYAVTASLETAMSVAIAIVSAVRSLRRQLDFPPKMHFKVSVCGNEEHNISEVKNVIEELANISVESFESLQSPSVHSSFPVSVPGFPVVLGVRLDADFSGVARDRLHSQMAKAEARRQQFLATVARYERVAVDESARAQDRAKSEKKAAQARSVASGMDEEISKLKALLTLMEGTTTTSADLEERRVI